MDEPFGAVDPVTRGHLQDELIRIQRDLRRTIVFVTRDFDEAIRLGDRIAVLRERSRIARFDTPEAILTHPADGFVSGLVGAGAALKRLGLSRVRDVAITGCPTVTVDDPLQTIVGRLRSRGSRPGRPGPAGGANEVLLLDRRGRPLKWLRPADLTRGSLGRAGTPVGGTVTRDATLRDALEAVLTDDAGRVVVTGRRGEYTGVVDMETLLNSVRALLEADRNEARAGRRKAPAVRNEPAEAGEAPAARTRAEREGAVGTAPA